MCLSVGSCNCAGFAANPDLLTGLPLTKSNLVPSGEKERLLISMPSSPLKCVNFIDL